MKLFDKIIELGILLVALVIYYVLLPHPPQLKTETLVNLAPAPLKPVVVVSGPLDLQSVNTRILGATSQVDPLDIVKAVNKERQRHGLKSLRVNNILMDTARLRAETIVKHQYFSHHDPYDGVELATVLPQLGYYYSYAAENIGMGEVSAEGFVNGFMSSPSHRATILDANLSETGVAVAKGSFGGWKTLVVVQHFAKPGTKRDWYGYDESEIPYYRELLSSIRENLTDTNRWLALSGGKSDYYRQWQQILMRQEEIIETLLTRMEKAEPFTAEERELIGEYNKNWSKAPG